MNKTMDIEYLKSILEYEPGSGVFHWACARQRIKIGAVAGSKTNTGYISICIDGSRMYAHRLAWAFHYGVWPDNQIDHIDGDRRNNSIKNLRKATQAENCQNKAPNGNTSKYLGVHWDSGNGKWRAQIKVKGMPKKYLGIYEKDTDAAAAYAKAKRELHLFNPEFTRKLSFG